MGLIPFYQLVGSIRKVKEVEVGHLTGTPLKMVECHYIDAEGNQAVLLLVDRERNQNEKQNDTICN